METYTIISELGNKFEQDGGLVPQSWRTNGEDNEAARFWSLCQCL